jgi:hypothetical protein
MTKGTAGMTRGSGNDRREAKDDRRGKDGGADDKRDGGMTGEERTEARMTRESAGMTGQVLIINEPAYVFADSRGIIPEEAQDD